MNNITICPIIILLLFCSQLSFNGVANENKFESHVFSKLPNSWISPLRRWIGPFDEGSHYKDNSTHQEWWYFIAFFNDDNSELKNYSMMVSFNQMGILDMFFCTIYEESNISYGDVINRWKGEMQASTPYVNVSFCNSTVTGKYPEYKINACYKRVNKTTVTVNVTYIANMKPMWLFFNTGLNRKNSRYGHYCIINNDVFGTVKLNDTSYNISGVGYHEHSWINDGPRKSQISNLSSKKPRNIPEWQFNLNIWDYVSVFLDNGWNIFSAKICQKSKYAKLLPGSMWITTDKGKHITECNYFKFNYLEVQNTSIPSIKIPIKIHIKGSFLKTFLCHPLRGLVRIDLIIEIENLHEFLWEGPEETAAVFEAACKVSGTIKWFGNCEKLNGKAMLELTRAVKNEE